MTQLYLIGLGSNMRHPRYGAPRSVLDAAIAALEDKGLEVLALSPFVVSRPLGPSQRQFINAAAVVEAELAPEAFLTALQSIERTFGRKHAKRRIGQRWRARVLDLDIILWGGGIWQSADLTIPHPEMSVRPFVLGPASAVAGDWRDPLSSLNLCHLQARLARRK